MILSGCVGWALESLIGLLNSFAIAAMLNQPKESYISEVMRGHKAFTLTF